VVESLLDWRHAGSLLRHAAPAWDAAPASIDGPCGHATRRFDYGSVAVDVTAGYEVPYTAWLRFCPVAPSGAAAEAPSVLWASVTPEGRTCVVHFRTATPQDAHAGTAVAEWQQDIAQAWALLGVLGDLGRGPGPGSLPRGPVGPDGALVAGYRGALRRYFGDLVAYWDRAGAGPSGSSA
jgi:hypothetical protein